MVGPAGEQTETWPALFGYHLAATYGSEQVDLRLTATEGTHRVLREVGDLLYWRVGDRLVAASVGHEDKEEPVVLFAGVTGSDEGFPD
ncbi:hypothetical protein QF034_005231 [Streptomyces africanus]|uniref:S9 family peptidase n=1 Tax=Streptomyces africanus TaxID=231024 RepID=A0ABU0QVF5_9ACTN|nr:hypothetical protein [Streptomyces africanus]MDQ0751000.1 hypothetical protein [Streptomyces africanus]